MPRVLHSTLSLGEHCAMKSRLHQGERAQRPPSVQTISQIMERREFSLNFETEGTSLGCVLGWAKFAPPRTGWWQRAGNGDSRGCNEAGQAMTRRACPGVMSDGLPATPLSSPCRASILVLGLTASGCVTKDARPGSQFPLVELAFLLSIVTVFCLCTGFLVLVSSRRRRRKVVRLLVAFGAGSVCGALWVLLVNTGLNAADFDALDEPAVLVVGLVAALVAAFLLSTPDRLTEVAGLSAITIGLHSLALPLVALLSFLRAGAQWVPTAGVRPPLTAVILGARFAGDLRTVGLSIGGLLFGLCFVFIGDRVLLRRRLRRSRPRFHLGRPED